MIRAQKFLSAIRSSALHGNCRSGADPLRRWSEWLARQGISAFCRNCAGEEPQLDGVDSAPAHPSTPLPRIPTLRGRAAFEARWKSLTLKPGLLLSNHQYDIFPTEKPTAGYALLNVAASYVFTRQHTMHILGIDAFNLSDRLYRNHLSFIKEFAPEIGRGVRFHYIIEFF